MKVFLTGSTGFIGRHVAARLDGVGCRVTCLVRKGNAFSGMPNISLINGDLQTINRETACALLRGHDYVIHCAAIRGEQNLSWDEYCRVNVDATRSLLEASLDAGVKRFVFLSSVGVMGTRPRRLPADEDTPYEPDGFYHKSKMLAERETIEFARHGLHTVIIRPSITYGAYDNGFFSRTARIAAKGLFPLVEGGHNLIHLTYVGGLVDAIVKALDAPVAPGSVYIIADAEPITFKEFVELLAGALRSRVRYVNIPSSTMAVFGARMYDALVTPIKKGAPLTGSVRILSLPWYYRCSKAVLELGYQPFDTREQAPATVEWLQANGLINV